MARHTPFRFCLLIAVLMLLICPSLCQRVDESIIAREATKVTSSTSTSVTPTSTPIYLQVTPEPPDPLGIANISGVYGPGTWAGWFLTICGSWVHVSSSSNYNFNTWAYLLYANWASFDLIRHSRSFYLLGKAASADWEKEVGSIGAAISIVFWAGFHACAQVICYCGTKPKPRGVIVQRIATLFIGILFPVISLCLVGRLCTNGTGPVPHDDEHGNPTIFDHIPALYYRGINGNLHSWLLMPVQSGVFLIPAAIGGAIMVVAATSGFLLRTWEPEAIERIGRFCKAYSSPLKTVAWTYVGSAFIVLYFLSLLSARQHPNPRLPTAVFVIYSPPWGVMSLLILLATFPLTYFMAVPAMILIYTFQAYLLSSVPISQSCFFMPCSPHKISDWDQSCAFFVGICLFLGADVIFPLIQYLRKQRALRRDLEAANERIGLEMERRQASGLENVDILAEGPGSNTEDTAGSVVENPGLGRAGITVRAKASQSTGNLDDPLRSTMEREGIITEHDVSPVSHPPGRSTESP